MSTFHSALSRPVRLILTLLLLTAVIGWGAFIRMQVVWRPVPADLLRDAGFNYRITLDTVKNGAVPRVDPLSLYPQGKRIPEYLPTRMYSAASAFHKICQYIAPADLKTHIFYFVAICSGLTAVPVFFILYAGLRSRAWSLIGALISVSVPMGLLRTYASSFRYEIIGIPLIMSALAAYLWYAMDDTPRRRVWMSGFFLAPVLLFASLDAWRMNLLWFDVFCIGVLVYAVIGKNPNRMCLGFVPLGIAYFISAFTVPYLRESRIGLAYPSMPVLWTLMFCLYRQRSSSAAFWTGPTLFYVTAAALIASLIFLKHPVLNSLDSSVWSVFRTALHHFNSAVQISPMDRMYLLGQELKPLQIGLLTNKWYLSGITLPIGLYVVTLSFGRQKILCSPLNWLVLFMAAVFLLLTITVANRNYAFFVPFTGILAVLGMIAFQRWMTELKADFPIYFGKATLVLRAGAISLMICLISIGLTQTRAYRVMKKVPTASVRYSKSFERMLTYIRDELPAHSVILSEWVQGYPIQTESHKATVLDGLFEVPEMRKRLHDQITAYWSTNEHDFVDFCRRYGVTHILLDRNAIRNYAFVASKTPWKYVNSGIPTPEGRLLNIVKVAYKPTRISGVDLLVEDESYILLAVKDDTKVRSANI